MKKILYMLLLSFLILSACTSKEDTQEHTEKEPKQTDDKPETIVEEETETEEDENDHDESEEDTETEIVEEDEEIAREYYIDHETYRVLPIEEGTNTQVALLTFDDAPADYALDIAYILKEYDAPAIFFVNGMFLNSERGKNVLKEIYNLGFEIGNHTQNHPDLSKLSYEAVNEEIISTNNLIEEITGEKPRFFRAPFGINTEASEQILKNEGMQSMNWTYGYDATPGYLDKDILEYKMVHSEYLDHGANLLMHDRQWTRDALPKILEGLRYKGYEFVNPKKLEVRP